MTLNQKSYEKAVDAAMHSPETVAMTVMKAMETIKAMNSSPVKEFAPPATNCASMGVARLPPGSIA